MKRSLMHFSFVLKQWISDFSNVPSAFAENAGFCALPSVMLIQPVWGRAWKLAFHLAY
jgi:hypothetical protein